MVTAYSQGETSPENKQASVSPLIMFLEPCCLTHLSDLCSHIHMMIKHYADVTAHLDVDIPLSPTCTLDSGTLL